MLVLIGAFCLHMVAGLLEMGIRKDCLASGCVA